MTLLFSTPTSGRSSNAESKLVKPALIFVEGKHKDRQGITHKFSAERVQTIADNTNENREQGVRIPFQLDHKKDSQSNIGDLTGPVYTKIIEAEDLPDPKHRHLLGKLGIFTEDILVKGAKAVEQVISKSIKTLSPGIDAVTESILEISATPFPAIVGPALFSRFEDPIYFSDDYDDKESEREEGMKNPMSMQAALGIEKEDTRLAEEYQKLSTALCKVLKTLYNASDAELKGQDPIEKSYEALEYFNREIETLFELAEEDYGETLGVSNTLPPVERTSDYSQGFESNRQILFNGRFK